MRIGIDMDCTLNNLEIEWTEWIKKNLDPGFELRDWTEWDVSKCVRHSGHCAYEFLQQPGSFARCLPQPGALEATKDLQKAGHELFVVTTAHPHSWPEKSAWLNLWFPHIHWKNHITTSRKGLLDLDALVDDGLHNFDGFRGSCLIFDQPWNRDKVFMNPPTRVAGVLRSWFDLRPSIIHPCVS